MINKAQQERIIKDYVWNPDIYGALMNGNIAQNKYGQEKEMEARAAIITMLEGEDEELIELLLAINNWRAKTIAGCLIGFWNRRKYQSRIGQLLIDNCGGVTGYCYALARFADLDSVHYLSSYLERYLVVDRIPQEKFQDWVLYALRWIDEMKGSMHSKQVLQDEGLWSKFINAGFGANTHQKLRDSNRWGDLASGQERFNRMMNYYREYFEQK